MTRALYLAVTPFVFLASVAAAIGEAVFAYPEEWRATWRYLGGSPSAPSSPASPYPFPDEYEWLVLGDVSREDVIVDTCAPCKGSGFEPDAKDLDGDPACRECGGSGEVVRFGKRAKGTL